MEEERPGACAPESAPSAVDFDPSGTQIPLSEEGIRDFDRRIQDLLRLSRCPGYTVEPLFTGVRTAMLYEKGALLSATLLEPPHRGEDVTRHVKTILNVPLSLSPLVSSLRVPGRLQVWGVVYRENRTAGSNLGPDPVNGVMDTLLQPDLRRTAREPLNFFCTGAFREEELQGELGARTHHEFMLVLQGLGLRVNRPHLRVCREITDVVDYSFELKQTPTRFSCEISGALVTLNPLERVARPEGATLSPFWVVAFGSGGS